MRNVALMDRMCLWLFAIVVFAGAGVIVVSSASASPPPPLEADHLKCYQMKDTNPKDKKEVSLSNAQFGDEQCRLITRAPLLCAPTIKNNGNDLLGEAIKQDYICYKVKCPKRVKTTHRVADQFGQRLAVIGNAQWLCTPAQKSDSLNCGQTAPLCNGECPPGLACRPGAAGAACQCTD